MADNKEQFDTEAAVKDAIDKAEKEAEDNKDTAQAASDEVIDESEEIVDGESEDSSSDNSDEKKSPFSKKNKKDKKDEQIEALTDQVKRQMAEFENFRKRTDKEKAQMFDMGVKTIVEKILPIVDNFERGLVNVKEGDDAFSDGILMIYRQLTTALTDAGVTPIEAVGKEFNPDLHNAVMQTQSDEYESGIVAAELQKGYMYKDTVVRHSMVSVVE